MSSNINNNDGYKEIPFQAEVNSGQISSSDAVTKGSEESNKNSQVEFYEKNTQTKPAKERFQLAGDGVVKKVEFQVKNREGKLETIKVQLETTEDIEKYNKWLEEGGPTEERPTPWITRVRISENEMNAADQIELNRKNNEVQVIKTIQTESNTSIQDEIQRLHQAEQNRLLESFLFGPKTVMDDLYKQTIVVPAFKTGACKGSEELKQERLDDMIDESLSRFSFDEVSNEAIEIPAVKAGACKSSEVPEQAKPQEEAVGAQDQKENDKIENGDQPNQQIGQNSTLTLRKVLSFVIPLLAVLAIIGLLIALHTVPAINPMINGLNLTVAQVIEYIGLPILGGMLLIGLVAKKWRDNPNSLFGQSKA